MINQNSKRVIEDIDRITSGMKKAIAKYREKEKNATIKILASIHLLRVKYNQLLYAMPSSERREIEKAAEKLYRKLMNAQG